MDCYSQHPTHQTYNNNGTPGNLPYYPGNYNSAASMRYAHAESGHQQNWIDGYSRYSQSQHHLNGHGNFSSGFNGHYGSMRENFHPSNEGREQFYYQTAHQTSSGYYGNHSYDSYRNASSNYHYHYGTASNGNYHQSASHPYYQPSYNASPEQFNHRYYPTPPPSAPPRDLFTLPQQAERAPNYIPSVDSEKLNERIVADACKSSSNDQSMLSSPKVAQSPAESVEVDRNSEVQQAKIEESSSAVHREGDKPKLDCQGEGVKVENHLDSKESKHEENQSLQPIFNHTNQSNQSHPCSERLAEAEGAQDSSIAEAENSIATDYLSQQQAAKDLQNNRLRKSFKEKDKSGKDSSVNRKSCDVNPNANDPFNRCSTPFASMPSSPFNHHHVPPSSFPPHQRLPPNFPHAAAHNYWYSQQHPHHHNWMMNPYIRNRRGSYTDAQTLPSSIPFARNAFNEKFKMYEESSPPPKRTKRKPKADLPVKHETKNEIMKNVTPLPGFLQTFGGTEIGRFSEAFFTSSESPNPYYNNSIESDVESPQPWDFDSLDGPVNMQVGAAFQVYGSETDYDSPINNFSELICNEY